MNSIIKKDIQTTLKDIELGKKCRVTSLDAEGTIRRRFLDLGLIKGTEIKALNQSPSGDPIAYLIRGAVIAIRSEDASKILVETI
ncbi:MAG: ferrous iron transport protein A [Clostridium sp.]